jgi:F0F1-type ATP synthase epsilon subunit
MDLTIVSPTETKTVSIEWLDIETMRGNLVIQPGHAPSYIVVKPKSQAQWLNADGITDTLFIGHGFVEVGREKITLITDRQEP